MKKNLLAKADHRGAIGKEAISRPDLFDPRIRRASPHRANHKDIIKRFFRLKSFPQREAKKKPKEETRNVPKHGGLMALFEKAQRQVNDQIKEHKMACRNRRTTNCK